MKDSGVMFSVGIQFLGIIFPVKGWDLRCRGWIVVGVCGLWFVGGGLLDF